MTDKYAAALERARKIYDEILNNELLGFPEQLREIFPELAESEDERIRKFLKDYAIEMIAGLESDISISVYDGVKGHDPDAEEELEKWMEARAWLEKQKEATCFAELMNKLSAKEQKVMFNAWPKEYRSENFDEIWETEDCSELISEGEKLTPRFKELFKQVCHAWYDKGVELGKKQQEQKPAEWSEEDKKMVETICKEGDLKPSEMRWLKSLRPPQYCENCKLKRSLEKAVAFFKTEWTGTKIKEVLNLE